MIIKNEITIIKGKNQRAEPRFFNFSQNNSGGYFITDHDQGVGSEVIVQAHDPEHANGIFQKIGEGVSRMHSYCECCGGRWMDVWGDEEGEDTPKIHGKSIFTMEAGSFREDCYVHYLSGVVMHVAFHKEEKDE